MDESRASIRFDYRLCSRRQVRKQPQNQEGLLRMLQISDPLIHTGFDAKPFRATIGDGWSVSRYRKGQTVFSRGDAADTVFYIRRGKVKVTVLSPQGKEAVTAILGSGEFCGEGCLSRQNLAKRDSEGHYGLLHHAD